MNTENTGERGYIQRDDTFKQNNTSGYTDNELRKMNVDLDLRLRERKIYFQGNYQYNQVLFEFNAELNRRENPELY